MQKAIVGKSYLWWAMVLLFPAVGIAQRTQKPVLHAKNWLAIAGKPLAATAGARIFERGGNAVDAACAMLAASCTIWDVLSWGGETQALIYNPHTGEVDGINALGVAPAGATADFFLQKDMKYPPQYGPLAAVTPGTPGGLLTMLAEYGTMTLAGVLAPALEMAGGYPIEAQTADAVERGKVRIKEWKYARQVFLPHLGSEDREAPWPGEIFRQTDLRATLEKLVEAERQALAKGLSRKEAIYAAYDRFYKGDIAEEFVRGVQEEGGLITKEDLANWKVYIEKPVSTTYKGITVYKLTHWVQGPVLLQCLNMLELMDMECLEYNSAKYLHALYQVMNLAFADRDFYYGDPYFPPEEPIRGLLSKDYARERMQVIDWEKNNPGIAPGDPYPFEGKRNPFTDLLEKWGQETSSTNIQRWDESFEFPEGDAFYSGTTTVMTADKEGWIVSMTPSGGWIPAAIAGRTGVGLSQRMQSFVLRKEENPFNVVEPGKRPRATLTPSLALKDGKPFLAFAVQGGDSQDQNLLQFFLNVVEWGMNVQEACEAANMNTFQLRASFGNHEVRPGVMLIQEQTPRWVRSKLRQMGYRLETGQRTSGPINAIFFDWKNGSMWGGSSNYGEDYGIGW